MIAVPQLAFLTLLAAYALAMWAAGRLPEIDTPTAVAEAVVLGAGFGLLVGAWT